jgi:hypothetical protein
MPAMRHRRYSAKPRRDSKLHIRDFRIRDLRWPAQKQKATQDMMRGDKLFMLARSLIWQSIVYPRQKNYLFDEMSGRP